MPRLLAIVAALTFLAAVPAAAPAKARPLANCQEEEGEEAEEGQGAA